MPGFSKNKVLQEAQRQIDSAKLTGYKIKWLVSDKNAANQIEALLIIIRI